MTYSRTNHENFINDLRPVVQTLYLARRTKGLTQREVAAALGTNQGKISGLESSQLAPQASLLASWAQYLGYDMTMNITEGRVHITLTETPQLGLGYDPDTQVAPGA